MLFADIVSDYLENDDDFELVLAYCSCYNGHPVLKYIAMRFFNTMAKNLVRDISDKVRHTHKTTKRTKAKVTKLSSNKKVKC